MRFYYYISIVVLLGISLSACQKKELTYHEYLSYIQNVDNGLTKLDSINGIRYELTYRPTDLMIYQSLNGTDSSAMVKDSLDKVYANYHYFILKISTNKSDVLTQANKQQFSSVLQDLSFHMHDMVYALTASTDTLHLLDYSAPRLYGLTDATPVLLVFKKENTPTESLTVNVKGLFGGHTQFEFKEDDFLNLPVLKFDL